MKPTSTNDAAYLYMLIDTMCRSLNRLLLLFFRIFLAKYSQTDDTIFEFLIKHFSFDNFAKGDELRISINYSKWNRILEYAII